MMKNKCALLCAVVIFCALSSSMRADVVEPTCQDGVGEPYIGGRSPLPKLVIEGPYEGLFLYEIQVDWSLLRGLSHWDLILPVCVDEDTVIEFPHPAGASGGEGGVVHWTGGFEMKDKSLDPDLYNPLIKYEPHGNGDGDDDGDDDGKTGSGTFYFYSNLTPVEGTFIDVLVAKNGNQPDIWGDLTGWYPSCAIPEPSTIALLGSGLLVYLRKRRSR